MTAPKGSTSKDEYFDPSTAQQLMLFWAVGARRELERWEAGVAAVTKAHFEKDFSGPRYWLCAVSHHLALVAVHHATEAAKLDSSFPPALDDETSLLLKDLRDIHEHWIGNMPIFLGGRGDPVYKSGKHYRAVQPAKTPFSPASWSSSDGPRLAPDVPATRVHKFLDAVEEYVLSKRPELGEFVAPRAASPWRGESAGSDRWWPAPDVET